MVSGTYRGGRVGYCMDEGSNAKCRRQSILDLAHSNPMGGHFGVKITWLGLSVDIKRDDHSRAPLVPLPVITVHFSRLAFDMVCCLPRTRSGFKYVLTCMCYASKYPEAIPFLDENLEGKILCVWKYVSVW